MSRFPTWSFVLKFYDFLDNQPNIRTLVIIEGTERALADRALEVLIDRVLPQEVRDLNLTRLAAEGVTEMASVREALAAMPFLAERRVVVVTDTETMRSAPRQELWAVAQEIPEGNTLVLLDLLSPNSRRPVPFGALAGRAALRVDTTAGQEVRARFIRETLQRLDAKAEARAVEELARSPADLSTVRNDLEKLALAQKRITVKDLAEEALAIEDPKAYKYARALTEGKIGEALAIAHDTFATNARNAGMVLLSALATECMYLWELSRHGGVLPPQARWRERFLRPLAHRIGGKRARAAFERTLKGIEAIVTGKAGNDPDDHRALVDRISAELSRLSR